MTYEAELRMLTDTFQRCGLPVKIAGLDRPATEDLLLGRRIYQDPENTTPLRKLLHPIAPATVYTIDHSLCSFLYLLLPQLQPDVLMVIGPYTTEQLSATEVLEFAESLHIDPKFHKDLEKFYASLPYFPKNSHLHFLLDAFFDRIWDHQGYAVESVTNPVDVTHPFWPDLKLAEADNPLLNAAIMEERYLHENGLIEAVRMGQTRRVESFLARITPKAFEQRLPDALRNVKNYCIITNTLLRKAAEQGGVHPVHIDHMSSGFATKIEQLTTSAAGNVLIAEMAQSYCRLVRNHATRGYSPPIQKAIFLIEGNLAGDLSLSRLAQELNVNSSYLSTLFKKETGQTFTSYINTQRIRHARHLLRTTNLQVQTIAQHCGILDFHYFCRIFKNSVGMTPTEYRNSYGFE